MTSCSGPRNLFIRELTAVHTRAPAGDRLARVDRLLQEAFLVDTPALDSTSFEDGALARPARLPIRITVNVLLVGTVIGIKEALPCVGPYTHL